MAFYRPIGRIAVKSVEQARALYQSALTQCEELERAARNKAARRVISARRRAKIRLERAMKKAVQNELAKIRSAWDVERRNLINALEAEATRLAVNVAEEVLKEQLMASSSSIAKRIRLLLEELPSPKSAKIKVNAGDRSEVVASISNALGDRTPNILSDLSVQRGTAKIEIDAGEIALDWKDDLRAIKTQLGVA